MARVSFVSVALALTLLAGSSTFILPTQPASQGRQLRGNSVAREATPMPEAETTSRRAFAEQAMGFGAVLGLLLGLAAPANAAIKGYADPKEDRLDGDKVLDPSVWKALERSDKKFGFNLEKVEPTRPQYVEKTEPNKMAEGKEAGYGLFVTRTLALFGAHLCELAWTIWIAVFHEKPKRRVCGLAIPLFVMSLFLILGGPYNFRSKVDDPSSCDYMWVPDTYFLTTATAVPAGIVLLTLRCAIPRAVTKPLDQAKWGPYSHWSTWVFVIIALIQLHVLRLTINAAEEDGSYKGACGVTNVSYYYPRHWGLIFYDWGQLFSFNLWIVGNFLWKGKPPDSASAPRDTE